MVFASLSPNHTSFDSASLHSSQASVRSAPSLHSSSTFVAPNSRRASRTPKKSKQQVLAQPFDFVNDLYQAAPSAAVSTVSLNAAAVRPPRVEYAPPVPPTALDFLQSSPPTLETPLPENIAPPASRRTPTPRSTTSSSAMPRPKTSDGFSSSNSRGSVKKVLSAFGFSSNKKTPTPAPVVQHAVRSTLVEQAPAPRPQRIKAVADVVRDQTKDAARKAMAYVKRKLNSKTPEEELPKTWEEYSHVYARNGVDIDDPPLPPLRESAPGAEPTPFEARVWVAPKPVDEELRQNVVNRLDLFGTKQAAREAQAAELAAQTEVLNISLPTSTAMEQTLSTASSLLSPSPSVSSRRSSVDDSLLRRDSASASSIASSTVNPGSTKALEPIKPPSLENHPAFCDIVNKMKEMFGTRVGMMTVLDDDAQLFLATGGMPEGVDTLPRSVSFCSHAILNEGNGLVVLDSQKDWRFANNLPSAVLGARFYAGVPLLAPTFGDLSAPSIAIGTLCVVDDKPRDGFTKAERTVLHELAAQASKEVEKWVSARMGAKLDRLFPINSSSSLPTPITELDTPPLTPPSQHSASSTRGSAHKLPLTAPAPRMELPATPPSSIGGGHFGSTTSSLDGRGRHSRNNSDTNFSDASSVRSGGGGPSAIAHSGQPRSSAHRSHRRPNTAGAQLSLATTTEDPVPAVSKDLQKVFDQATRMLSKSLQLSLVYLAALDLSPTSSSSTPTLRILASHGLPNPAPAFDPSLHLKALRAPEGGLMYSNPSYSPHSESTGYAGGLLIPILEVRRVGYVLCGYTKEKREFDQKDLTVLVRVAEQLEGYVTRLGKSSGLRLAAEV